MTNRPATPFGATAEGTPIERYVLDNGHLSIALLTWGATVQSLLVPDSNGDRAEVVLGFDELAGYTGVHPYFGAVVGRYANRIARGRFSLDGAEFQIPTNDRGHALHGGPEGFHRQAWACSFDVEGDSDAQSITFSHVSPDGTMGFPGTLKSTVSYMLAGHEVRIDYRATTDSPTVVNLTQHSYFNLSGAESGTIDTHELEIPASRFVPVDADSIPLEYLLPVEGTPFDFRSPKPISRDIESDDQQVTYGQGYDHSWVLDSPAGDLSLAGRVSDAESGRVLEVLTTEPGVQFYSGNQLDGTLAGKDGVMYGRRGGLCLETQHLPDSPNQPDFPSVVLQPGEVYGSTTLWRFSTR